MKLTVVLFALLSSTVAVSGLHAAEPAEQHEHTELGEHMEKIGGAFRRLGREVADPTKNEDALQQVTVIRTHAEAAAKLQPEKTADVPADQREKFLSDYHAQMKSFLEDVSKLETALKAGKNDEAAAIVKAMKTDMDQSHKEFRKKKERKQ